MKSTLQIVAILFSYSLFAGCSNTPVTVSQTQEPNRDPGIKSSPSDSPSPNSESQSELINAKTTAATETDDSKVTARDAGPIKTESAGLDQDALAEKELERVNQEFNLAVERLSAEIEKLATNEEKQKLFDQLNPEPAYTKSLLALAKKYPKTDSAFSAAMSIVLERQTSKEFVDSMDFVLEHHGGRVQWHRIAEIYLELVPSLQIETWMRKMIATAESDEVKVKMTYLLYRYFDQFPTFVSTIEYNPLLKKRYSKEQIDYIFNQKDKVRKQMLADLKELKEKYSDIKALNNQTVKDVIDGPIFELEHLQVGSIAPDIEGEDFDGINFKLSDYRGKVVMLDFWGQWCPPCRAMFPHERELIEQLVGKPFVLIGVNSDRRLQTAIKATNEENLVWRNFWCGPKGRTGPIAKKWNVSAWPTVYLIDANGVIRYKEVFGKEIDKGIESLLAEMGHKVSIVNLENNPKSNLVVNKSQKPASIR